MHMTSSSLVMIDAVPANDDAYRRWQAYDIWGWWTCPLRHSYSGVSGCASPGGGTIKQCDTAKTAHNGGAISRLLY